MPFISRVSFWRRAGSRLLGQEVHPISQNGKFAFRKSYGACNCNEKEQHDATGGREVRPVAICRCKSNASSSCPITKISNRRLPSGDKIINKRRFSPLVCVSLSGWCETGCGSIQSPTAHGGDNKCWRVGSGQMLTITTWNREFGACNIGCGVGSPPIDRR